MLTALKPHLDLQNVTHLRLHSDMTREHAACLTKLQKKVSLFLVYESCEEAFTDGHSISRNYQLYTGVHMCDMSMMGECGGGGWTTILKMDGNKVLLIEW